MSDLHVRFLFQKNIEVEMAIQLTWQIGSQQSRFELADHI